MVSNITVIDEAPSQVNAAGWSGVGGMEDCPSKRGTPTTGDTGHRRWLRVRAAPPGKGVSRLAGGA
jgi:hypothetical protein